MMRALLLLALATLPPACSRSDSPKEEGTRKRLLFAGCPKMLNNPVFEVAHRGALDKAAELGDVEILWQAPERGDAIRQADILRAFIRRRVDGIFVAVNDAEILRGPIDEAVAAGIPVVGFDSDSPSSKRFTHYGVEDVRAGREGGRLLLEKMGAKGKVGILHGTQGAPNLEKRIRGFREHVKENAPDVVLLEPVFCDDNTQKAVEVVKALIEANPDLTGLYFSGGWPLFAEPPGPFVHVPPGKLVVVAFDAIPPEPEYVRRGYVHALTAQRLYEWGEESVRLLREWHAGKRDFPPFLDSGFDVVTAENVEAYGSRVRPLFESR